MGHISYKNLKFIYRENFKNQAQPCDQKLEFIALGERQTIPISDQKSVS